MFANKFNVRFAVVSAALLVSMGAATQVAFAGPTNPPPGKTAASNCYRKNGPTNPPPGKTVVKKGCNRTHGPTNPPPGAK